MTDVPRDPADARDPQLAARLETEPLDDVTRARLVRAAMAASSPDAVLPAAAGPSPWPTRVRRLAVAAAIVAVAAVGLTVILRDDPQSVPTASVAEKPESKAADELQDRAAAAPQATSGLSADAGALRTEIGATSRLGDLGDVGTAARLRRAVTAATATDSPATPAAASALVVDCAVAAAAHYGTPTAAGTGTVKGKPVTVFVVVRRNAEQVAVVVDAACNADKPVAL